VFYLTTLHVSQRRIEYTLYVASCARQSSAAESDADRERFIPAKDHVHCHLFNYEFNLEFHKPKQDQCDTCELYKMKQEDETYQHHMQSKKAMKEDRERVKSVPCASGNGQQYSNDVEVCTIIKLTIYSAL